MVRLMITPPRDYLLSRDVCSYGYFLLEPNRWDPALRTYTTTIDVGEQPVTASIVQPSGKPGGRLVVRTDRAVNKADAAALRGQLSRSLRLDEPDATIAQFHAADPRWKSAGRGRLMRSPTFFEDVIKTVTSCNVAWPSTIIMNRRLCESFGRASVTGKHAFPTPEKLARCRPSSLRARCSVGYRDARIVALAKMFVRGEIDTATLENRDTPDQVIFDLLQEWPGVGPYAAANIMQLLGRYERLPLDSESVRHGRDVLGFTGTPDAIMRRVHAHFEPFAQHRFRSYWFELWDHYERRRGPSWTWVRETVGATFTASKLKREDFAHERPPGSRDTPDAPKAARTRRP